MKNPFHILRVHRKRTHLTQSDVAFLLNLKDNSHISRCEKGERQPTIDIILTYHLLFDSQLGSFFADHRQLIQRRIASRLQPLIASLEEEAPTEKTLGRIHHLKKALTRLTV